MSKLDDWFSEGMTIAQCQELSLRHSCYFAWVYVEERIEDLLEENIGVFDIDSEEEI